MIIGLINHSLEGTIKLKYSGGEGLVHSYWRLAEVAVIVKVVPSLLVTRWDALPAELPHQCYIVLDLLNSSLHEMDLHYTPSKHLLIEAGESCRVPVPVDRCPLDKIKQSLNMVSFKFFLAKIKTVNMCPALYCYYCSCFRGIFSSYLTR